MLRVKLKRDGIDMQLTVQQFSALFPANKHAAEWVEALNAVLPKYDIDTPVRLAAFLSQCGHESMGFTATIENLNYSAEALLRVFGKYFRTPTQAHQYARNPKAIGNRVYANRMGNGSEDSGDGYRHRGHGLIQLTGKDNHKAFAASIGMSLEDAMAYMQTRAGAVESACYYWSTRKLNPVADTGDVVALTKKINGGVNGLADRKALYAKALKVLQG